MTRLLCLLLLTASALVVSAQDIFREPAVADTLRGPARVKAFNERFRDHFNTDPVMAVGFARQALMLAEEIADTRGMAAAYNNLGVAYRNQGALDKALEYYITSLHLYDSIENLEGIASTRNNIANIYALKKDYGQAMRYFEESRALFEQLDDPVRLVGSLNNLGNLYNDINMHQKALEYYEHALALSQKTDVPFSDPLVNMGNLYFNLGNYQVAVDYYEKALALVEKQNDRLQMINILSNMGITFVRARQPARADTYLQQARVIADELEAFTAQPAIFKAMAENYALQNRWREAYEMQTRYDALREKIYSEESSRRIAQMEMVLDFQETERALEVLRRDDEIKTMALHNTRLIVVLILMGLFVIVGAVNFAYTSRKKVMGPRAARELVR